MIDRACISLSNACNLKCKYCHFQGKQEHFAKFSISELKNIIENIHEYCKVRKIDVFKLGIVGAGEPMLQKEDLFALLMYIEKNNYKELRLYTISNGTLKNEEDVRKFYAYREIIKLCISLDGHAELHNAGRAKFDTVMQTIDIYKKIFGCAPHINATVNKKSYESKERLVKFFSENGLTDITFSKLVGYSGEDLYISDNDYLDFLEYVKNNGIDVRQNRKEKKYDCTMYGVLCGVGRTNVFYTPEGVYPCGRFYKHDDYKLGKMSDSMFEIENNMKRLKPVTDGECYYKINVEGKK